MHGKTSPVYHTNQGVFKDIASPFTATRYHSLIVDRSTCPPILEITAWIEDQTIMGLRHREYPWIEGVQFHPESILTDAGKDLLRNFLRGLPEHQKAIEARYAIK
jgi:anthranilate synthase component II